MAAWLLVGLGTAPAFSSASSQTGDGRASADTVRLRSSELIADVGQLTDFIEATHPDPYGTAGKLAYHRRLHRLLREIPDAGLTRSAFHALLEPFVAAVGDGHTRVEPLRSRGRESMESGPGIPIDFRILAAGDDTAVSALYVQGFAGPASRDVVGARLTAVAGVPVPELIERQRHWKAYENAFGNLQNLIWALWDEQGLHDLLPEWRGGDSIQIRLQLPSGSEGQWTVALGAAPRTWEGEAADSRIVQPPTRAGEPAYRFLDAERQVALLRLDNTWAYREGFESLIKLKVGNLNFASQFYRLVHDTVPPADTVALVEGLPRATTVLAHLVEEMRAAHTQTLVVDLQRNSGGNSMLVNMLLYYLYGRRGWAEFFGHFHTIRRLTAADVKADSSGAARFPNRVGDYDLSGELDAAGRTPAEAGSERFWRATTISFADELTNSVHEGYYAPPQVIAVISPRTFSGGFWVAASLHRMGARLVGVPSGQAGNAFANIQFVTLANSGITVAVSARLFVLFPEASTRMPVLPVDDPLTFARWRAFGFDPNAGILQALDLAGR